MFTSVPAKSVGYYLDQTVVEALDYYAGDKVGVWWTPKNASETALRRFGCVDGEIISNDLFTQLANGKLADGTILSRGGSGVRMLGYDCQFAPPKSVSLVFAFADEDIRRKILELHNQAVRRALQFMFDWALIGARRGSAGSSREKVAGLVAAIFTEFTSRDNDPQIHSHAVIPNAGVRMDGTVGAVDNHLSKVFQLLIGAIYQAQLAFGLIKMGFQLERKGRAFEIAGIPATLIRTFSKRRNAIEKAARSLGVDPSRNRAAADIIALDTRPAKSAERSLPQLQVRWLEQLRQAGYDERAFAPDTGGDQSPSEAPETMVAMAVDEVFETNSVLPKSNLFASVAERLIGTCDADAVEGHLLQTVPTMIIPLVENRATGNTSYSTRTIVEIELELLRIAQEGRGFRKFVPDHLVEAAIAKAPTLSEEQQDAIRHAFTDDQIAICEGSAGTGKSFLMSTVADASRAAGLDVWGLGPSWVATGVIGADTDVPMDRRRALSGFLNDVEAGRIQLAADAIIILDEAGMVGTRELQRLASAVQDAGCKLVLAGDTMQLSPVSAGAPMRLLVRVLGTSRMLQIRRQKQAWSRAASMEFAKGHADVALRIYQARGNIEWIAGRAATLGALADRYVTDMLADREIAPDQPSPTSIAIASRNADVDELNVQIRTRLQEAGFIDAEDVAVAIARRPSDRSKRIKAGAIKLAIGDRVVLGETVILPERTIRNADVAQIVAIEAGTPLRLTLKFESDGLQITRTVNELVGFRAKHEARLPLLRHAYAGTVHRSQGQTVDRAYIASIHSMSREAMYVAMTRHRDTAQLFVDTSRLGAGPLTGLPNALLAFLKGREKIAARNAAQLEGKREAFFAESVRQDNKVNASDFVSDLGSALNAASIHPEQTPSRFQSTKATTARGMEARLALGLGDAARFEWAPQNSGAPNWLHRLLSPWRLKVQSMSTSWVDALAFRFLRAVMKHPSLTAVLSRVRAYPGSGASKELHRTPQDSQSVRNRLISLVVDDDDPDTRP